MPLLVSADYNRQCIRAAEASRLPPNHLHAAEQHLFGPRLADVQTQEYLRLRNGILRMWVRNPMVCVTRDEVLELVLEKKHTGLALFAHEWLARNGYINFGCVEVIDAVKRLPAYLSKRRTIVIIGAGVSGLSCARQIEAVCKQFPERWTKLKELPPRVIIVEGRRRIGGRVYSHPLSHQEQGSLPHNLANTAELGAQIITGFEQGNPLNAIVRGQLALHYNNLKDDLIFFDYDGSYVDKDRDFHMEALYIKILEVVNQHKWKPVAKHPLDRKGSDLVAETKKIHVPIPSPASMGYTNGSDNGNAENTHGGVNGHAKGYFDPPTPPPQPPPSLGALMDSLVIQYQREQALTSLDLRLLNWHYANLEYANASNVCRLSLGGWDQDGGNEFEGAHAHVVGGYSQVPRGLWKYPEELDVRLGKIVTRISTRSYANSGQPKHSARIECADGSVFDGDHIVCTLPLGVMKHNSITFDPPLPSWKTDVIDRLGFGVLNKVVLVFQEPFWDVDQDMIGLLNRARNKGMCQADYAHDRGKCYMFWNCMKTSGRPMLTALMAGDAALQAESCSDEEIVDDVTQKLARVFQLDGQPRPTEAIVTRWKSDPFTRGSYSSLGPQSQPGDYDEMAKPLGCLHFAGEATCGTHPATVHGAYLSGLRAAAEVVEAMVGPVPTTGL